MFFFLYGCQELWFTIWMSRIVVFFVAVGTVVFCMVVENCSFLCGYRNYDFLYGCQKLLFSVWLLGIVVFCMAVENCGFLCGYGELWFCVCLLGAVNTISSF